MLKRTTELLAGCQYFRGLLTQIKNISLQSSGKRRKQNFSTQQSQLFLFAFFPLLFFCFSCLTFFFRAGHLVGFILVGKVFGKAFRILGVDQKKGRWLMNQDFYGHFRVNLNVTWFFAFFFGLHDWIKLLYGLKDLFTLHKLADKIVLDR